MNLISIPPREILESIMRVALEQARIAEGNSEVPVGAVVAGMDGAIIASAYNQVESDQCAVQHAELLAIQRASARLGRWRLGQEILCVTLEPCTMCAGAILNARIPLLVFATAEPRTGACGSIYDVLQSQQNSAPRVIQGIGEQYAQALMKDFFRQRRE
jgi:tRNA(adenine34) deaminase